jgi:hypothetical protein
MKVMDNFKKSVDYFNSYGIDSTKDKDKPSVVAKDKKPLADANQ